MRRRPTAREREHAAAQRPRPPATAPLAAGEALRMLVRRGFAPTLAALDLPFPPDLDEARATRLAGRLGHYAYRLFLRGAIARGRSFAPRGTTRYLRPAQASAFTEELVALGLAARLSAGHYRLLHPARSFGGTLEWYVARELAQRYGWDYGRGRQVPRPRRRRRPRRRGRGGGPPAARRAEVLAAAQPGGSGGGRPLGPPARPASGRGVVRDGHGPAPGRQGRAAACRGGRERAGLRPRRVKGEVWALTPHVYAVNAKADLMRNVGLALAEGLRALSPPAP